jgi:DNA (cytosine-5)-methyltransferase 1
VSTVDVDLFAGPGGWDLGAQTLGLRLVGVEWDAITCRTARTAGFERQHADVAQLDPVDTVAGWADEIRGLVASPPCQGFSVAGVGKSRDDSVHLLEELRYLGGSEDLDRLVRELTPTMEDPRTLLVLEPLRWVFATQPAWCAWEQVPAVLPIWEECAELMRAMGYSVAVKVLSAEQYGVPQVRRRAILLARRGAAVTMPAPTHSRYYATDPTRLDGAVEPWVSMADALGWGMTSRPYPTVAVGTAAGGTDPQALGGSGARAQVLKEREDGRWVPQPEEHALATVDWADRFNDQSGSTFDPLWPALRPSTAVAGRGLVQNPGVTGNRFNGATKSRNDGVRITVEEAAVLQSFPASYPWAGRGGAQFQQVGDAVPPLMARAILGQVAS